LFPRFSDLTNNRFPTRRQVLATFTLLGAAGAARLGRADSQSHTVRVGCQDNGYQLKAGDLEGLLAALRNMKEASLTEVAIACDIFSY
jgi:hypothetical protein